MFNKKSVLFNGQLYVLKLKKIKENELYKKTHDISEIKSDLILDKSFLSIIFTSKPGLSGFNL